MIRELAFVVTLPSEDEAKALKRQLFRNLTPLGQHRVRVVVAPSGGLAFLEGIRETHMAWWDANVWVNTEDVFICVAHEEGLPDWAATVPETNVLVWVRDHDQIEPYRDTPLAQALLAESVSEFGTLVMERAPSLDPDDALEAPFAGVAPMVEEMRPEPPSAPDGIVVDWAESEDEALEDEDGPLGEDGAAEPPAAELPAAADLTDTPAPANDPFDEPSMGTTLETEELPAPPELDDAPETSGVDEPDEEISETESSAPASVPTASEAGDAIAKGPSDIFDDIAAKQGLEAIPDDGADLPEAPPLSRSAEFVPVVARDVRDAADDQPAGLSDRVASTPHPYVLMADYMARRDRASASPQPQAPKPAPRQMETVRRTTGPVALPPPVQAVWDDPEPQPKPVPRPSPATSRPAPPPALEVEMADLPDDLGNGLDDFDIDGVAAPSPFGDSDFLFGPVPTSRVATAPPRAQPTRSASAPAPYPEPDRMSPNLGSGMPGDMRAVAPATVKRAMATEPDQGSSPGLIGRLRLAGGKSPLGAAGRLLSGSGGKPRPPKAQYTDSELAGFLDRRRGIVICVGALKGGVGKTAVASGLADWAGKILSPSNAAAAYVDANLNNPDAAGFFREEVGRNMVSVRAVVVALLKNQVPPDPIKSLTDSVALYPERPGAAEYQRAEIARLADYLRVQYRAIIVDLANVFPSMDGGPSATAALYWLTEADVVVVPSDVNPTSSLPDAYQYIEGLAAEFGLPEERTGKPVFVPYIVPNDSAVYSNADVKRALAAVAGQGALLYPIPYNPRVMVAGATHQSLTAVSKPLSTAYRALLEGAIVAFTNRDREL
ncbi:MAG: hypothetical protein ACYCZN_01950 [Candidatus Dormibacteria bacterium]